MQQDGRQSGQGRFRLLAIYRGFIRWCFNRFYREFAWTYDTVAWLVSRGLWYRWTAAALPYLHGRVLELGCGTGSMQHALAATRPGDAIGIDASPQMLARTRRRIEPTGLHFCVLQALAQHLPFASSSFHSVLATFPTEYLFQPATLAEIRRVLTEKGRLVIVDAATFTSRGPYERLVDAAYWLALMSGTLPEAASQRHPYQDILEAAGFTVAVATEQVGDSQVKIFVASPAG